MSWPDFERLLREKADASAVAELEAGCSTVAALERVELGLARAVGMEEVRVRSWVRVLVAVRFDSLFLWFGRVAGARSASTCVVLSAAMQLKKGNILSVAHHVQEGY